MWGKIIIPMYRLWLNGLYGLYGPRCPLSSKRLINWISLSLSLSLSISLSISLEFPTPETRRWFLDMCEVYKYVHSMYKTPINSLFQFSQRKLWGHSLELQKPSVRTNIRKYFFSNRVVDSWNDLPEEIVTAPSLDAFQANVEIPACRRRGIIQPSIPSKYRWTASVGDCLWESSANKHYHNVLLVNWVLTVHTRPWEPYALVWDPSNNHTKIFQLERPSLKKVSNLVVHVSCSNFA